MVVYAATPQRRPDGTVPGRMASALDVVQQSAALPQFGIAVLLWAPSGRTSLWCEFAVDGEDLVVVELAVLPICRELERRRSVRRVLVPEVAEVAMNATSFRFLHCQ